MIADTGRPVLFFDGLCNLCNHAVQFVVRHDKKGIFLFASLQSHLGEDAIRQVQQIAGYVPDSMILFYKGTYYTQSTGALEMARLLNMPWKLLYAMIVIPSFIRNAAYRLIARNRYKWFGKKEACMIPTPALQSRFLSD
jgi:predicted DCC family thiol-disulfide oxidoreductase YuxK